MCICIRVTSKTSLTSTYNTHCTDQSTQRQHPPTSSIGGMVTINDSDDTILIGDNQNDDGQRNINNGCDNTNGLNDRLNVGCDDVEDGGDQVNDGDDNRQCGRDIINHRGDKVNVGCDDVNDCNTSGGDKVNVGCDDVNDGNTSGCDKVNVGCDNVNDGNTSGGDKVNVGCDDVNDCNTSGGDKVNVSCDDVNDGNTSGGDKVNVDCDDINDGDISGGDKVNVGCDDINDGDISGGEDKVNVGCDDINDGDINGGEYKVNVGCDDINDGDISGGEDKVNVGCDDINDGDINGGEYKVNVGCDDVNDGYISGGEDKVNVGYDDVNNGYINGGDDTLNVSCDNVNNDGDVNDGADDIIVNAIKDDVSENVAGLVELVGSIVKSDVIGNEHDMEKKPFTDVTSNDNEINSRNDVITDEAPSCSHKDDTERDVELTAETFSKTSKVIQTILLFNVYFFVGIAMAVLGPTLPDLQCVFKATLSEINYLLLVYGVGEFTGTVLTLFLLKTTEINLLLGSSLLFGLFCLALIPMTTNLCIAAAAVFGMSTSVALLLSAGVYRNNQLWTIAAFPINFMSSGSPFGSLFAPLLAQPFLHAVRRTDFNNQTSLVHDMKSTSYSSYYSPTYTSALNVTRNQNVSSNDNTTLPQIISALSNITQTSDVSIGDEKQTELLCGEKSLNVRFVFLILASVNIFTSAAFFFIYFKYRHLKMETSKKELKDVNTISYNKSKTYFAIMLLLLFLFNFTSTGTIIAYGSLLSTYGLRSGHALDVQYMATMTSVFWVSNFGGRVINTILAIWFNQTLLMGINLTGLILSSILLVASPSLISLWIGSIGIGLFTGCLFPLGLTWSRERIQFSHLVIIVLLSANTLGVAVEPFIAGELVSSYGPDALMMFMVGVSAYTIFFFFFSYAAGSGCLRLSQYFDFTDEKNTEKTALYGSVHK